MKDTPLWKKSISSLELKAVYFFLLYSLRATDTLIKTESSQVAEIYEIHPDCIATC